MFAIAEPVSRQVAFTGNALPADLASEVGVEVRPSAGVRSVHAGPLYRLSLKGQPSLHAAAFGNR